MIKKEDLLSEINLLRDVFISNGYPKKLVKITNKKYWKIELEKEMKALLFEKKEEQQEEKSYYYDVLPAPYIAEFSEQSNFPKRKNYLQLILQIETNQTSRC